MEGLEAWTKLVNWAHPRSIFPSPVLWSVGPHVGPIKLSLSIIQYMYIGLINLDFVWEAEKLNHNSIHKVYYFIKYFIKSIFISFSLWTMGDTSMIDVIFCKETIADSVRNNVKLNHRAKANASISAQGLKYPLHRAAGKTENSSNSRNPPTYRASSNKNPISTSNRTLVERSNIHLSNTVPTVRCATIPANSALGHSNPKATNGNARLSVRPKGRSNIQVTFDYHSPFFFIAVTSDLESFSFSGSVINIFWCFYLQNISTDVTIHRDMRNNASRAGRLVGFALFCQSWLQLSKMEERLVTNFFIFLMRRTVATWKKKPCL